jgi:hypothetical protein
MNFWQLYRPLADSWTLWYNSEEEFVDVASGSPFGEWVQEEDLFSLFQDFVRVAADG